MNLVPRNLQQVILCYTIAFLVILIGNLMIAVSITYSISYQRKIKLFHQYSQTNEVLNSLSSRVLLPHIVQPTRIKINSKTLADNVYSNMNTTINISNSVTATILDYFTQFLIAPGISSNITSAKSNIFEEHLSKFDRENFILDYLSVDWENLININTGYLDQSFVSFSIRFNSILYLYAPLKRIYKQKV